MKYAILFLTVLAAITGSAHAKCNCPKPPPPSIEQVPAKCNCPPKPS